MNEWVRSAFEHRQIVQQSSNEFLVLGVIFGNGILEGYNHPNDFHISTGMLAGIEIATFIDFGHTQGQLILTIDK